MAAAGQGCAYLCRECACLCPATEMILYNQLKLNGNLRHFQPKPIRCAALCRIGIVVRHRKTNFSTKVGIANCIMRCWATAATRHSKMVLSWSGVRAAQHRLDKSAFIECAEVFAVRCERRHSSFSELGQAGPLMQPELALHLGRRKESLIEVCDVLTR